MLDDPSTLHARDAGGLLSALARFPTEGDGAGRAHRRPLGFEATGAAAVLVPVIAPWIDGRLVAEGTQVLVDGGFHGDDVAAWRIAAEAAGSDVVVLGAAVPDTGRNAPFGVATAEPSLELEDGPMAAFEVVRVLGHAAAHHEGVARLMAAMTEVATACAATVASEANPAKSLAWRLHQRVPLLITPRGGGPLQDWAQQVFARVGKTLAVTSGDHPALVAATAFEARHALGDDLVALVLGAEDDETRLVAEVLETRIAQVERLVLGADRWPGPLGDTVLDAALVSYSLTWVAAYGALLAELDPGAADVYATVRAAATEEVRGGR